jgi:hypothetical protein
MPRPRKAMTENKKTERTRKTAGRKPAADKKASEARTNVVLQYADMSITYDDIVKNAMNKYRYDMDGDVDAVKNIDLYVKPDEKKVYFVINNSITGDYDL